MNGNQQIVFRECLNESEEIYTGLWRSALDLFERGEYETDPLILDPADMRRGLTLRARLAPDIVARIEEYTKPLNVFLPNQYFTPASDIHLTVLTVVSCYDGFHHDPEMDEAYCNVFSECTRQLPPPQIIFTGISASPSCLLLRGVPANCHLRELRHQLKCRLKASSLPHSVDLRYPLTTAHATLMRFVAKDDISKFTAYIKANQNHYFGTQRIDEVEFVTNDWCHKKSNTKLIKTFELR